MEAAEAWAYQKALPLYSEYAPPKMPYRYYSETESFGSPLDFVSPQYSPYQLDDRFLQIKQRCDSQNSLHTPPMDYRFISNNHVEYEEVTNVLYPQVASQSMQNCISPLECNYSAPSVSLAYVDYLRKEESANQGPPTKRKKRTCKHKCNSNEVNHFEPYSLALLQRGVNQPVFSPVNEANRSPYPQNTKTIISTYEQLLRNAMEYYGYFTPRAIAAVDPRFLDMLPCGVCSKMLNDNVDEIVECRSGCNFSFHRQCVGLSELAFFCLNVESNAEWACNFCLSKSIPLIKYH